MFRAPLLAIVLLAACDSEKIERLEIRAPGLELMVNGNGSGHYRRDAGGKLQHGSFSISRARFATILSELQHFRSAPDVTSREGLVDTVNKPCPRNYVTDKGIFYVRWSGPSIDQYYLVDLGCDPAGNAERNRRILGVLESLPTPGDGRGSGS